MTDLQARISGVVLNRLADYGIRIDREVSDSVAEAVMVMPGIAITEPITEQCGAPGDEWECPACSADWVAKDAGPLDIRWELAAVQAQEEQP